MNPPSALEQFLEAQVQGGLLDSSGKFTLAREKALEKLAAFQLPREGAWVLKIVQSAVASGASHLKVRLSHSESTFSFDPQGNWSVDSLEGAFYNPEASSDQRRPGRRTQPVCLRLPHTSAARRAAPGRPAAL